MEEKPMCVILGSLKDPIKKLSDNEKLKMSYQPFHFLFPQSFISLSLMIVLKFFLSTQRADAALPLPEASMWSNPCLPK